VAEHVGQLILEQLDEEYRDASQEQIDAVVEQLKVQLPQIVEQLTGECDRAEWTAKQRGCILRATTVKRASRCGV
jgi:hypothetical protein